MTPIFLTVEGPAPDTTLTGFKCTLTTQNQLEHICVSTMQLAVYNIQDKL